MPTFRLTGTQLVRDGIIWFASEDLDRSAYVRVAEADDGRWEVVEVYIPRDDRPVTTDDLRRIPIGQIEAFANSPDVTEQLHTTMSKSPWSLERANREADAQAQAITERVKQRKRPSLKLSMPADRRSLGDDFYRAVAAVYLSLVADGEAPAPKIADANDVPVTTARRWVKEARRRGHLPAGRAGKAG